MMHSWQAHLTR